MYSTTTNSLIICCLGSSQVNTRKLRLQHIDTPYNLKDKKSIKQILILILTISTINSQPQSNEIEDKTIGYYFGQIAELEINELIKQKILIDSLTISPKYKDLTLNRLNEKGFVKYIDIKATIYRLFFKNYLYLQKVEYGDDYYVLYFTMTGFDNMQWDIIKMKKHTWNRKERLSREKVEKDDSIEKILFNYDEGTKNIENIRLFIKNHFLIMERGNLYHSLYDLKNQKVLINKESPWHEVKGNGKEELNKWIKKNLHDKIERIIYK